MKMEMEVEMEIDGDGDGDGEATDTGTGPGWPELKLCIRHPTSFFSLMPSMRCTCYFL